VREVKSSARAPAKSSKEEEEDSFNCNTKKVKTMAGSITIDEVITEARDKENM